MRIVGGKLKSRRLFVSSRANFRPTADRVKESIFNILKGELEGKRVLDLFAGTGNLGIEAISRGAVSITFVDLSAQSIKIIRRNLEDLECLSNTEILKLDYRKALQKLAREGRRFEIVFADPPYLLGYAQGVIDCLKETEILSDDALVVIEHHKKEKLDLDSSDLVELRRKKFGDTMVSILSKKR